MSLFNIFDYRSQVHGDSSFIRSHKLNWIKQPDSGTAKKMAELIDEMSTEEYCSRLRRYAEKRRIVKYGVDHYYFSFLGWDIHTSQTFDGYLVDATFFDPYGMRIYWINWEMRDISIKQEELLETISTLMDHIIYQEVFSDKRGRLH